MGNPTVTTATARGSAATGHASTNLIQRYPRRACHATWKEEKEDLGGVDKGNRGGDADDYIRESEDMKGIQECSTDHPEETIVDQL